MISEIFKYYLRSFIRLLKSVFKENGVKKKIKNSFILKKNQLLPNLDTVSCLWPSISSTCWKNFRTISKKMKPNCSQSQVCFQVMWHKKKLLETLDLHLSLKVITLRSCLKLNTIMVEQIVIKIIELLWWISLKKSPLPLIHIRVSLSFQSFNCKKKLVTLNLENTPTKKRKKTKKSKKLSLKKKNALRMLDHSIVLSLSNSLMSPSSCSTTLLSMILRCSL